MREEGKRGGEEEEGQGWRTGRRGEEKEEEKGGESHACVRLFPSGQSQEGRGRGQGLRLLLLTTSGLGSPTYSHKDIIAQALPLATHLLGQLL